MSLYFGGEAATVLLWSRLSDFIGRKPVLLRGTLGLVVATILFGLSRTFWTLAARYVPYEIATKTRPPHVVRQ